MKHSDSTRRNIVREKLRAPAPRGLVRERLDAHLAAVWDHRVTLVVGPAGSGKTTVVAQLVARLPDRAAWYRAERTETSQEDLVAHLGHALAGVIGPAAVGCTDVESLAAACESWEGTRALIVIDDLHHLEGTEAEQALERLIGYLPAPFHLVAATRCPPGINLSRLRVAGDLLEIEADALRFRSWEVERLFQDVYGFALPPEDVAALTARTEGWAAGLQLFHLAASEQTPAERRRAIAALAGRTSSVREYLADNVLAVLPDHLRSFLRDTAVLYRLTPGLCDQLRGRDDSAALLAELERGQVFTIGDEGCYRYHEVLRTHLERILAEALGEDGLRERYRQAGALLEAACELPDAIVAFGRAGDWDAVARLMGRDGEMLAESGAAWLDHLPPGVIDHDPWFQLATARRHRADGRLAAAVDAYRRAEAGFDSASLAARCREERLTLAPWLTAAPPPVPGWLGILRRATLRRPLEAARGARAIEGSVGRFAEGVALLLAGRVADARAELSEVAQDPDCPDVLTASALLALHVASSLGVDTAADLSTVEADRLAERADDAGLPVVGMLCRAVLVPLTADPLTADPSPIGLPTGDALRQQGNLWAAAIATLIQGQLCLVAGHPLPASQFEAALSDARALGSDTLEAWFRSLAAVGAVAGDAVPTDGTGAAAREAEALARSAGVPGARAVALVALAACEPERRETHLSSSTAVAAECGLDLRRITVAPPDQPATAAPSKTLRISCFGGLSVHAGDGEVDLSHVKPRARSALRLLAVHGGHPVHREVLIEALWPGASPEGATRNLHTAVSAIRRLLDGLAQPPGTSMIVRDGDGYLLEPNGQVEIDVRRFHDSLSRARDARASGDLEAAIAALRDTLDAYAGPLLPEEGPAEWVIDLRERSERDAANAARWLAELLLESGRSEEAAEVCQTGLRIDRYNDGLWRLLRTAHEVSGDAAAAARVSQTYDEVLAELGVTVRSTPPSARRPPRVSGSAG